MERTTQGISEDWLSVWIGLLIFVLSLGVVAGMDILEVDSKYNYEQMLKK